MNLIEQAAKRLAELQRAGAESSPLASDAGRAHSPAAIRTPTPEALVRELNASQYDTARSGPALAASVPYVGIRAPLMPLHKVEIDYERLKNLGLVVPDHLESWIAHELRMLKRPILRNVRGKTETPIANANRVMVTSALPGEGKTFTAVNLALSMAMEFEDSVLLVDGDLPHPTALQLLGVPESPGLLDLLSDPNVALEEVVLRTNLDRLMLLPAGSGHQRATELIASDRMAQLMDTLAARLPGRIIVFDSPPLLPTSESRVLATYAGQVVMVVAADSTPRNAVEEALAAIERSECVMMVLNKVVSLGGRSYYGYGYSAGGTPD